MEIRSLDELLKIALLKQSDIERLKVLQLYFMENVEFDYIYEIAQEQFDDVEFKTSFSSEIEKLKELEKFQLLFGKNFHFSESDVNRILNILGEKVQPSQKIINIFGQERAIKLHGYDGSIYDCLKRLASPEPTYIDGLIVKGMCKDFAPFVKSFCNYFGIDCKIAGTGDHFFNLINIDGEEKIFDYTRMLGIRDDYKNPNNQNVDDWFNMSYEEMFKYKPSRKITSIDYTTLENPITQFNYRDCIGSSDKGNERL